MSSNSFETALQFTVTQDKIENQILTIEKLELERLWGICIEVSTNNLCCCC